MLLLQRFFHDSRGRCCNYSATLYPKLTVIWEVLQLLSYPLPQAYCYLGISTDVLKQHISQVVLEEFNGVVTYMIKCKDLVDWMNEFNLLMAAKFKSKIQQFNMRHPQNTYLFASNLVGIE